MNEIQAILAQEQLKLLPKMLKRRREIANIYNNELKDIPNLHCQKIVKNVNSAYYSFVMKLTKGNLKKFRKTLKENGIETSPMFTTIYKTKIYQKLSIFSNNCPISEILDDQTFTIPLHVGITNTEINYIIKTIKKILDL